MRCSKSEIYLHFVWTTHQRLPLITPQVEQQVYTLIQSGAKRCHVEVLAIGGMPDHLHLVVKKPTTISEAQLMQRVKGVSSTAMRNQVTVNDGMFRWQENYGVFSFHKAQIDRVVAYVHNQKRHHTANQLRPDWEEPDEEVEVSQSTE